MPPNEQIIRLLPEDYPRCGEIWDMARQPNTGRWYDEIVRGVRIVYVFTRDDAFLGEGALVLENSDPDYTITGRRVYLSRLIVKPEARRQGIGGRLVDHLCAEARRMGYREISLGVDLSNHAARRLYAHKGFTTLLYEGEDEYGPYQKLLKAL